MAPDRFGRSLTSLWATEPEEGGRPLQVWALLDSGEYASAEWEGGGPQAGWFDLIAELLELRFHTEVAELDQLPLSTEIEPASIHVRNRDGAFIGEDIDPDTGQPGARFEVHLNRDGRFIQGPRDTDFESAVTWARERADVVQFRPEGTNHHFTLGSSPVPETPAWPEGSAIRPRPARTPLDGSVAERPWPVRASCTSARPLPSLPAPLRATVVDHVKGGTGWTAMIDVIADCPSEAMGRLDAAFQLDGLEDTEHFIQMTYSSEYE